MTTDSADAAHLSQYGKRIRYHADHVRRVDDIEGLVGKAQMRSIHPEQLDVVARGRGDVLFSLTQHWFGNVDPRHRTIDRVVRSGQSRSDTDFQDLIALPKCELTHCFAATRLKYGTAQ